MPWAGGTFTRNNGTYSGSSVWQSDAAAAIKIRADRHDTHDQDIAQGINNCLTKDGQNSPTQHISWGSFKITNLANGTSAGDAVNRGQLDTKANASVTLTAGNGLTGGGDLTTSRTVTLGTPGALSPTSINEATSASHTHEITGYASLTAINRFLATQSLNPSGAGGRLDIGMNATTYGSLFADNTPRVILSVETGTLFIRPNGFSSVTNQATYSTAGLLSVPQLNVGSGFTVTKITVGSSAPGTLAQGEIYFRTT